MERPMTTESQTTCTNCALTFETLIADPLTRAVMDSDGVSVGELISLLEAVWANREANGLAEAAGAAA